MTDITYWAQQPPLECAAEATKRASDYYQSLQVTGRLDLFIASYANYNAILAGNVGKSGVNGFSTLAINHYRNFLTHLLTMTVSQRPAFQPRATNTDHLSQVQCLFAQQLLDYYLRDKRLEVYLRDAVEYALLFGEGYLLTEWDSTAGETYAADPETGAEVRTGDIAYSVATPLDVIRDVNAHRASDCQWYIVRRLRNKFDLAAKFASEVPELAEKIVGYSIETDPNSRSGITFLTAASRSETDLIAHYTLYHSRTPSCPEGRVLEFLDAETILYDGPLPYKTNPVNRVSPAEQIGTPFGYSIMFDLLPLQDTLNGIYSTIKTNQETFGVQNVLVPRGSGLSVQEIIGGLNMIEYDAQAGKIEALNLTKTPAEIFSFMQTLEKLMEVISGVNSVARGDPQASLKSGAALALVQAQAIQFSHILQYAYTKLLENTGQATINALKAYAEAPRIAEIVGKNNQTELKEFTSQDLSAVNRVIVDQGNAMTRTTAGRVELAQMLIQMKQVDTPEQLLQVIQTGNLETLTEGRTQELLGIKAENEFLASGKEVPVMITDMHVLHIKEHASVMADPASRTGEGQGALVAAVTMKHIQEHISFLTNPEHANLLGLLGQPQLQGPQVAPPGNLAEGLQQLKPTANQMAEGAQPNMPSMPRNPLTKEKYVPTPGPGDQ